MRSFPTLNDPLFYLLGSDSLVSAARKPRQACADLFYQIVQHRCIGSLEVAQVVLENAIDDFNTRQNPD